MRYRTIVADPPWEKPDTGARTHSLLGNWDTPGRSMTGIPSVTPYPQMTLGEIGALPILELADRDAHLYVWTFGPYIPEAYRIVGAWGFAPSALLTGCKAPMGLGFGGAYVPTTEHVLFARRGRDIRKRRWDSTWFAFKRGAHSAKPDAFLDIVETVSPGPYLELFARRQRLGWDTWGGRSTQPCGDGVLTTRDQPHAEKRADFWEAESHLLRLENEELRRILDAQESWRTALREIAARGCERYTTTYGCLTESRLRHDARYGDDQVCNPCHAHAAETTQ